MDIVQQLGQSKSKYKVTNIRRDVNTYNEYINPSMGVIYSKKCTDIHGLTEQDPRIRDVDEICVVWSRFL